MVEETTQIVVRPENETKPATRKQRNYIRLLIAEGWVERMPKEEWQNLTRLDASIIIEQGLKKKASQQ